MDAAATLVWLAPDPADAQEERALASWASAHGARLVPPGSGKAAALPVDAAIAEDVERLLDRARDAVTARDARATDDALAQAEAELRAHPELPQAAWQMAEVERMRARAQFRSGGARTLPPSLPPAPQDHAWLRAEALDGGRVPGLGEPSPTSHPAPATLVLDVSPPGAGRWLDGARVQGGTVATRAGPHVLVVTWDGAPVWASWIDAPAGSSTVHVAAPASPACSADDVSHARLAGDAVDAAEVRCGAWIGATRASGGVRVAMCESGHCGPLLEWRAPAPWTWTPPAPPRRERGWPTWATWGLAGAGAAIATGVVLVVAGAFKSPPSETRFVSGGVKSE